MQQSQWADHAALAQTEAAKWRETPACPRCGFPEVARTTTITQCRMSCCHATGTGVPSVGQSATKLPSSWPFSYPLPTVLPAPFVSTLSVPTKGTGMGKSWTVAAVLTCSEGRRVRGVNEQRRCWRGHGAGGGAVGITAAEPGMVLSRFVAQPYCPMIRLVVPGRPGRIPRRRGETHRAYGGR